MDMSTGLAADTRSLDGLKQQASRDPKGAVAKVATQFEALFMQSVIKSMRDAIPKGGLLGDSTSEMYTGMMDAQLAQKLSGLPGGLRNAIERQLSRNLGVDPNAAKAAASGLRMPNGFGNGASVGEGDETGIGSTAASLDSAATEALNATGDGYVTIKGFPVWPDGKPGNQAAAARAAAAQAGGFTDDQAAFVRKVWAHAASAQSQTGVPAHFVVGQAALESGWGRHEIPMPDGKSSHNLFGIKAGGDWRGKTVDATTTEYIGGKACRVVQRFRAYGSYAEAFRDWGSLMAGKERYGGVLRASGSVSDYAQGMQKAGYATDPRYGAKLEQTINRALAIKRLAV